jgi:hypothetical protein
MPVSVKGIQYSYQIDFFNQVPTRLKSQIHDLPVLSVQEPTPIDKNVGQGAVVPNNEQRQSYAGVRAASTGRVNVETAVPSLPTSNDENVVAPVAAAPLPSAPMNNAIDSGYRATPANLLAGQNPIQLRFDFEYNLNRQRPETTENLSAPPVYQPQLNTRTSPAVEAEDFPVADVTPGEPVKAIPKALFLQAQRAYKPDYGSYLQPAGYESPLQTGAVNMADPAPIASRPLETEALNGQELANTSIEPSIQTAPEPIGQTDNQNQAGNKTMDTGQNQAQNLNPAQMMQSFLDRQAQRLYEAFANTTVLGTANRIDLYF